MKQEIDLVYLTNCAPSIYYFWFEMVFREFKIDTQSLKTQIQTFPQIKTKHRSKSNSSTYNSSIQQIILNNSTHDSSIQETISNISTYNSSIQ